MWVRRMTKKGEWLPWYRQKGYKGDLTEDEKKYLDAFTLMPEHPAASEDSLPEEVRDYIADLEFQLHDTKRDTLYLQALVSMGVGAYCVYEAALGDAWTGSPLSYLIGFSLIFYTPFYLRKETRRLSNELLLKTETGGPETTSDVGIRRHWDMMAISRYRRRIANGNVERPSAGDET